MANIWFVRNFFHYYTSVYANLLFYWQTVTFRSITLTLRLLMSYIYGAPILDVSRSHTTTQHSRQDRGHGYLSVVRVVCCQVEVSATSWSLVQRSPTDCAASLCVIWKHQEWLLHIYDISRLRVKLELQVYIEMLELQMWIGLDCSECPLRVWMLHCHNFWRACRCLQQSRLQFVLIATCLPVSYLQFCRLNCTSTLFLLRSWL